MHRCLLPLLLASLGFLIIRFVVNMPLLEWQISEIVTDFPSTYKVDILPSPWTAYPGDSLEDGSYILRDGVRVDRIGKFCDKENLKFVVRRSQNDEVVERILNANQKNTSWLFGWVMIELALSGIYIWWFIIEYKKRGVVDAVIFTGIAGVIYIFLILFSRIAGPHLVRFGMIDCYGTVTFSARLSKVHYETLIALFTIILAELGALGVMLRQIKRAAIENKESSKSAVG